MNVRWQWVGTSTPEAVAQAARACLDTPFVPQGRLLGVGTDCIGVGVLTCRATGLCRPDDDVTGYPMVPDGRFVPACEAIGLVRAPMHVGGMAVFAFGASGPHHLGIVVPYSHDGKKFAFVHAIGPGQPKRVVESRLLPSMRVIASYRIPGVACS
jgi:hypothetical protein